MDAVLVPSWLLSGLGDVRPAEFCSFDPLFLTSLPQRLFKTGRCLIRHALYFEEGKAVTHWTRLSCHRFSANDVRFLLGVIAYNLGNLLRLLVLEAGPRPGSSR